MLSHMLAAVAQAAPADDGLTLAEILADVPSDPAAIVVYLLILASIIWIWRSSRTRRPGA